MKINNDELTTDSSSGVLKATTWSKEEGHKDYYSRQKSHNFTKSDRFTKPTENNCIGGVWFAQGGHGGDS